MKLILRLLLATKFAGHRREIGIVSELLTLLVQGVLCHPSVQDFAHLAQVCSAASPILPYLHTASLYTAGVGVLDKGGRIGKAVGLPVVETISPPSPYFPVHNSSTPGA